LDTITSGTGQEERRRGSPRRSGDGGKWPASGVPVGGRLRRGGGVLRAVPRLAAEAGKVAAGATSERDTKHGAGGKHSTSDGRHRPFKGGRRDARGWGGPGDAWGGAG
jgi:hypothetical protein